MGQRGYPLDGGAGPLSRSLFVAGIVASALHLAVISAVGSWRGESRPGLEADAPVTLALLHVPRQPDPFDEQDISDRPEEDEPILIEEPPPPQVEPEAVEPAPEFEPPTESDVADESEPMTAPDVEPDSHADPGVEVEERQAERASSDPAPDPPSAEPSTEPAHIVEMAQDTPPLLPTIHQLRSAPPTALLAMLRRPLQRAATSPVKAAPPAAASSAPPRGERRDPVIEHRPKPQYPTVARRRGYEGTVVLRIEVLADGNVGDIEVRASSGHSMLDRQAERTIREKWRFKPGRIDGSDTTLWIDVPIEFRLVDA